MLAPPGPPATSSAGPVFLVHGVWPDSEDWWVDDVAAALEARGLEPLPVPYFCFIPGYLFGYGTTPPADRIARFVEQFDEQHARTQCETPVRWNGIGFSAGTMVLTKAAERGVSFERLYFAGSPIPMWANYLREPLNDGRIQNLINYYSPTDLLVWMTCGAGIYGFHRGGGGQRRVVNRLHWWTHFTPLWDREVVVNRVVDELAESARGSPHTCFERPWFRRWYETARDVLRTSR